MNYSCVSVFGFINKFICDCFINTYKIETIIKYLKFIIDKTTALKTITLYSLNINLILAVYQFVAYSCFVAIKFRNKDLWL